MPSASRVFLVDQSGNTVNWISGSLPMVITSGVITLAQPNQFVLPLPAPSDGQTSPMSVTAASGGTPLGSGSVISMTVRMLPGQSGHMYIGAFASGFFPYSGYGFVLAPGESLSLDISNFRELRACATISGEKIAYFGTQY